MEMTFPYPDSTALFFFFFLGNALFILGLLDTFFICGCPACFRAFEQFATLYISMHLPLFIWFVNTSYLHFLFAVVCFGCTFCPFRDLENFRWDRPFVHLGNQRILVEVSSLSIQGLREFCLNVNLVVPSQGRLISVFGISLTQLLLRRLRLRCLSFEMIYIPLGNFIWTMYKEFHLNDVHPFKGSYRFFVWMIYIHLRNLIVFYLDDVHPFKESYCLLFGRCTSI